MFEIRRLVVLLTLATLNFAGLAACSIGSGPGDGGTTTLGLGYFPNVTHAPGIVAIENGLIEEHLPGDVELRTADFNAGGEAITALLSGSIDATFIGPNPAINGYAQSGGEGLRIVSGAASGGAYLVVSPEIDGPDDLEGTTLSTPALGNTQDVALRAWLAEQGYETDTAGGGDVQIAPQENAQILTTFIDGAIDGAWVPEPWATRLVDEGGGEILVDERDLWPDGQYVTTHLIVATDYLEENPDVVKALIEANLEALDLIDERRDEAEAAVGAGVEAITGRPIPEHLVAASFDNLEFTYDPIASSLFGSAADAETVDLLDPVDLDDIYDLTILNESLDERGLPPVEDS